MFISSKLVSNIWTPKTLLDSSSQTNFNSLDIRISFQLKNIKANSNSNIFLSQSQKDPLIFKGHIIGPQNSPYQNGKFHFVIKLSQKYPFQPPQLKFQTKIFHPNVSKNTGIVICQLLSNSWSPLISLNKLLQQIIKILREPDIEGCYQTQISQTFAKDLKRFKQTAQEWTQMHAYNEDRFRA